MAKMNIPLTKNEIMSILQTESLPRNWKSSGTTISAYYGAYTFKSGFAMSLFADGLKKLLEMNPNATRDSMFVSLFGILSNNLPHLFVRVS